MYKKKFHIIIIVISYINDSDYKFVVCCRHVFNAMHSSYPLTPHNNRIKPDGNRIITVVTL